MVFKKVLKVIFIIAAVLVILLFLFCGLVVYLFQYAVSTAAESGFIAFC